LTGPCEELRFRTDSPEATLALGRRMGRRLQRGLVFALVGPLGAGKTLLTRGIALGNGLDDSTLVTSPTFTLIQEYDGRIKLYHLDLYRLTDSRELRSLGFDEILGLDDVVLIEWADKWPAVIPESRVTVTLEPIDATTRDIRVSARGELASRYLALLNSDADSRT
jgi:tRNA threonylcarbamoyladenosine biosynthesis protein TsaE